MRLPLPELPKSTVKPLQVCLTQRNTALQREEREKRLVIGLRAPHFFLGLLGSPFTHREFLRSLFPAFFKKPDGGVIRQHVPKKQLEQECTFVGIGASFLHTTYILVFYKLNSAIERGTKPDA